jgi:hypothetical protein
MNSNYRAALDAASPFCFYMKHHWHGASERGRSRSQAVAADGRAGVVRRDAMGLLAWAIGLRGGAIEDSWRAEGADLMVGRVGGGLVVASGINSG